MIYRVIFKAFAILSNKAPMLKCSVIPTMHPQLEQLVDCNLKLDFAGVIVFTSNLVESHFGHVGVAI
jgi:hypothetical protein